MHVSYWKSISINQHPFWSIDLEYFKAAEITYIAGRIPMLTKRLQLAVFPSVKGVHDL